MLTDERDAIANELDPPFSITNKDAFETPLVFCSPHSGRVYPQAFIRHSKLDAKALRKSEDCFVDQLFAPAAEAVRAPFICAHFPRAYLDVNREPYELDSRLFKEQLPEFANQHTTRVVGGLGTIARIVADGEEIYDRKLPLAVAYERINHLYKPFHTALAELVEARQSQFGYAVLIDCHSMPSTSMQPMSGARPDIVLGDRFGVSCDPVVPSLVQALVKECGYHVCKNRPYAGGFITEHYGRPAFGCHALQIELNRGLYMNERRLTPTAGYKRLQNDIESIVGRFAKQLPALSSFRSAAE